MKEFLYRNRHALAILPFLLSLAWFFQMERLIPIPTYYIEVPLDDHIPFIPAFVIPYIIWYVYVGGTLAFFYLKTPREFVRLCLFLAAGMSIACTIYALFPNGQLLRPRNTGNGALGELISGIYRADTPTNSLPSVHVIYSMGTHIVLAKYLDSRYRPVQAVSFVLATLICASTVHIKQHSIVDVLAGAVVTFLLYKLFYCRTAMSLLSGFTNERNPLSLFQ